MHAYTLASSPGRMLHPPYSPDWMEQFVSYYEVIAETNDYCEGLEQQYVLEGTQEIEKRGNK